MADKNDTEKANLMAGEIPCPACGKPIRVDASSCGHCGRRFTQEEVMGRFKLTMGLQLGCLALLAPVLLIGYCAMQPSDEEVKAETQRQIAERDQGLHCIDGAFGENIAVVMLTEARLKDPSSFEHIETRIGPRKEIGTHTLIMRYRARNGFGGMTLGTVSAEINSFDCSVTKLEMVR